MEHKGDEMKIIAASMVACIFLYAGFQRERAQKQTVNELHEFIRMIMFCADEIETRGSILEAVFTNAAGVLYGQTRNIAIDIAKGLSEGNTFEEEWKMAVDKHYGHILLNDQERECIRHCLFDFLLPERTILHEQLLFDAQKLTGLYDIRTQMLYNECRLCRVISFSAAAFGLLLAW